MPKFEPIKQIRVSDEVAEQLKRSILLGHFKAEDRLPSERELAEEFKVSRGAIREALRLLEKSGFIETRHGVTGGAYVTELTFEHLDKAFLDLFLVEKISILEFYEVRLLVDPEVARLAALKVTPEYAQRLRDALEAEELSINSLSEDITNKQMLHFILAEMCGNRVFEALVRSLMGLTRRVVEAVQPDPQWMHPAGMHRPVVEAVLSGDAEAAALAMKKHAIEFGENFFKMEKAYREKKSTSSF
jgi:GntR family transcriptional repressor for pyruvate dehydrogenase complex